MALCIFQRCSRDQKSNVAPSFVGQYEHPIRKSRGWLGRLAIIHFNVSEEVSVPANIITCMSMENLLGLKPKDWKRRINIILNWKCHMNIQEYWSIIASQFIKIIIIIIEKICPFTTVFRYSCCINFSFLYLNSLSV